MLGKATILLSFLALTNGNDGIDFSGSSTGSGQLAIFIPFVDISLTVNQNNGKGGGLRGTEEENSGIDNGIQGSNSQQHFGSPRADIINNCRSTYYIKLLYRSGNEMKESSKTRLNSQDSVTIGNITDSTIWIYGSSLSYFEENLSSSNSRYCFSPGDCYREVNLGSLNGRTIEYGLCEGSALSKKKTKEKTQPPIPQSLPPSKIDTTVAGLGAAQHKSTKAGNPNIFSTSNLTPDTTPLQIPP